MIVSLNEIENVCYRAALGVGLPQGLAEDAARTAVKLASAHADGLALMLKALRSAEGHDSTAAPFERKGSAWVQRDGFVPALIAGPVIADLLAAEPGVSVEYDNTDVPEAVAAAMADGARPSGNPLDIDDGLWRELARLASRTYVPASDASRLMGAGAGLLDND